MSYIQDSLSKDEKIEKIFKLHWFEIFMMVFKLILFVVIVLVVGLFLSFLSESDSGFASFISLISTLLIAIAPIYFIYGIFYIKLIEQGVTNKRVVLKKGVISRDTQEIKLDAIETVEFEQGIIGRILGYGTVKITGRGISDLVFKNIDNPLSVKKDIESLA